MAIEQLDPHEVRDQVRAAIAERRADGLGDVLRRLPPSDAADALDELQPIQLGVAVTLLGDDHLADLLENMAPSDAARLLLKLGRDEAADVLEQMDPDDAADVVQEIAPDEAEAILVGYRSWQYVLRGQMSNGRRYVVNLTDDIQRYLQQQPPLESNDQANSQRRRLSFAFSESFIQSPASSSSSSCFANSI